MKMVKSKRACVVTGFLRSYRPFTRMTIKFFLILTQKRDCVVLRLFCSKEQVKLLLKWNQ